MPGPHQLTALAHLAALQQAMAWLGDVRQAATQPGLPARRPTVPLAARAAARHDALLRQERAERARAARPIIPSGASPAPTRLDLLDADQTALATVVDAAWIAASTLRTQPGREYGPAWTVAHRGVWAGACAYLTSALPDVDDTTADEIGAMLTATDRHIRAIIGCGPAWIPVPGVACPACPSGPRHMQAEVSSPDERDWTIRCRDGKVIDRIQTFARQHAKVDLVAVLASITRHHRRHPERTAA